MRHLRKGKQLGRVSRQRKALLRSLAVAIVEQGKIKTTLAKARVLKPYIEKAVTKAKQEGMNTIRALSRDLNIKSVRVLMEKWAPLFKDRKGGYTRIIKLKPRTSDASPMAYIEFVEKPAEKASEKPKKANKPKAKVAKETVKKEKSDKK